VTITFFFSNSVNLIVFINRPFSSLLKEYTRHCQNRQIVFCPRPHPKTYFHPPDAEYPVEGPLDADSAEQFVADRVCEVFPGLWVSGMSLCATLGGPRMGPIFGGMLLSGQRLAQLITAALRDRP